LKYVETVPAIRVVTCLIYYIDAISPVALRWLCDSPRTGCARRTTIYVRGASKQ